MSSESECSEVPSSVEVMHEDKFYLEISIDLDRPLLNGALGWAHPEAKINSIRQTGLFRYDENGEAVALGTTERDSIAYPYEEITFMIDGHDKDGVRKIEIKNYKSKNGVYFSIDDLVEKVIEFETLARNYRRIGSSIDMTNLIFDGILPTSTLGVYEVNWI